MDAIPPSPKSHSNNSNIGSGTERKQEEKKALLGPILDDVYFSSNNVEDLNQKLNQLAIGGRTELKIILQEGQSLKSVLPKQVLRGTSFAPVGIIQRKLNQVYTGLT